MLAANHPVATVIIQRVTRLPPKINLHAIARRNGATAVATRAWGLRACRRFPNTTDGVCVREAGAIKLSSVKWKLFPTGARLA